MASVICDARFLSPCVRTLDNDIDVACREAMAGMQAGIMLGLQSKAGDSRRVIDVIKPWSVITIPGRRRCERCID